MSPERPLVLGEDPAAADALMRLYEERGANAQEREFQAPTTPDQVPEFATAETWPRCPLPRCGSGLHIVDQNPAGDFAFECLAGDLKTVHKYECVYRVGPKRYEPRPLFDHDGKQVPVESVIEMTGWLLPLTAVPKAAAPSAPVEGGTATLVTMPTIVTPAVLARLFKGGASMTDLAAEYGIPVKEVEASIRAVALMEAEKEKKPKAPKPAPEAKAPVRRRRQRFARKPAPDPEVPPEA